MLNPPFNLPKILRFEGAMICSKLEISAKFGWWPRKTMNLQAS
jgi:hypothetical protein